MMKPTKQGEEHDSEQLSSSFVPAGPHQATEREAIVQIVSGEFHSEGFITLPFPTLFPFANYALHLLVVCIAGLWKAVGWVLLGVYC